MLQIHQNHILHVNDSTTSILFKVILQKPAGESEQMFTNMDAHSIVRTSKTNQDIPNL